MQILGLVGIYFDCRLVVEVKTFLLLFRLEMAILWEPSASDVGGEN